MKKSFQHKSSSLFIASMAGVALSVCASSAFAAGSDHADVAVTANVNDVCHISAGTMAFGTYDSLGANAAAGLEVPGTIGVICTAGLDTTITLDQGTRLSDSKGPRAEGSAREPGQAPARAR